MRKSFVSGLMIGILLLVGCTTTQLTQTLNAVADAAAVAGIVGSLAPAPYGNAITTYAGQVSKWCVDTTNELATSDTNDVKIQKIIADAASILVPQIPGLPPNLQAVVTATVTAVEVFIRQLKQIIGPSPTPTARGKVNAYKLSYGDKHELGKIRSKANDTIAYIAAHPGAK